MLCWEIFLKNNKCYHQNKSDDGKFSKTLINVTTGINVMMGNYLGNRINVTYSSFLAKFNQDFIAIFTRNIKLLKCKLNVMMEIL